MSVATGVSSKSIRLNRLEAYTCETSGGLEADDKHLGGAHKLAYRLGVFAL